MWGRQSGKAVAAIRPHPVRPELVEGHAPQDRCFDRLSTNGGESLYRSGGNVSGVSTSLETNGGGLPETNGERLFETNRSR
jgi:hypothetical protein